MKVTRPASYLIGIESDPKTVLRNGTDSQHETYLIGIQYLAPSNTSGFEMCKDASDSCRNLCLFYAGMGGIIPAGMTISPVNMARIERTKYMIEHKADYWVWLKSEIHKVVRAAKRKNAKPAIRLDGTSGLPWHRMKDPETGMILMDLFPEVMFYDYTKSLDKMISFLEHEFPTNYWLTFSRSEVNEAECLYVLSLGGNVAVPFLTESYPETFMGYPTINGSNSDLRFHDGRGKIVALCAKGKKAKADKTGFIIR